MALVTSAFKGTERYVIEQRVGVGGMGVVFRARDAERCATVALKLLNLSTPEALYQFKQEFRSLADIGHPNLVQLYELSAIDEYWFFTMEFVDGVHLFDFVRGPEAKVLERQATPWDATLYHPMQLDPTVDAAAFAPKMPTSTAVDDSSVSARRESLAEEGFRSSGTGSERPWSTSENSPPGGRSESAHVDPAAATPTIILSSGATGHGSGRLRSSEVGPSWGSGASPDGPERRPKVHRPLGTREQFDRLRCAFAQLGQGLRAVHRAGFLHCDIKNTNVMVSPSGRVVVLDYGLVVDAARAPSHRTRSVVGTPLYMAPELFSGAPQSKASDMYSLGVMLYMALAGFAPYVGSVRDVSIQKGLIDPPELSTWAPEVPPALETLCRDLLRRDADTRPSIDEFLDRLGGEAGSHGDVGDTMPELSIEMVGRDSEWMELEAAFRDVAASGQRTICLHAGAGMGKSTLLSHFTDSVARRHGAVVLSGRCHERETVPFKALDGLFDALAIHLARLPSAEVGPLLPEKIGVLARMFPVLEQVERIRSSAKVELQNPRASRREAGQVLRELVSRLARRSPLVLVIDDVQWGDRDSGVLLLELLEDPAPPILVVLSYRTTEGRNSAFLNAMSPRLTEGSARVSELVLDPLALDDVRRIASRILGLRGPPEAVESIVAESQGNAYFVAALANYVREGHGQGGSTLGGDVTLEQVLHAQVEHVPPSARRLLDVLAVAGAPVAQGVAQQAAGLLASERHASVDVLRSRRLVRTHGMRVMDAIEPYHDRVRELVWNGLDDESRRDCHRRIAWALVSSEVGDAELLARHFDGAGDTERATPCYLEAGDVAAEALAFDRAAEHYARALEMLEARGESSKRARIALAESLANAGRGREAARAYLAAVPGASTNEATEWRQRAAALMLDYGQIEEARGVLEGLLVEHGIPLPATGEEAVARVEEQRARLRLRGWRYEEQVESEVPPKTAHRIDVLWTVGMGFVLVDTRASAEYSTRALIEALDAGDPRRIARGLGLELAISGMAGRKALGRNRRLVRLARELCDRIDDPYVRGMVALGTGIVSINVWEHAAARRSYDLACEVLRNQCVGRHGEANRAELSRIFAYYYLGELRLLRDAVRTGLREADKHGEWQMATSLRCGAPSVAYLVDDDLRGAEAAREQMWAQWQHGVGYLRHYWDVYSRLAASLYERSWTTVWRIVEEEESILFHPALETMSLGRMGRSELMARVALAAASAADPCERSPYLREALRLASLLHGERLPAPSAMAHLIRSSADALKGDTDEAVTGLAKAELELEASAMKMHAMAARRRRGLLLGGDSGLVLVREAERWFSEQGVVDPARFADFVLPGRA